jgi:hypothetical protein
VQASTASLIAPCSKEFSLTAITSPTLTWYEGISTLIPLTEICPWLTTYIAALLVLAKPKR